VYDDVANNKDDDDTFQWQSSVIEYEPASSVELLKAHRSPKNAKC